MSYEGYEVVYCKNGHEVKGFNSSYEYYCGEKRDFRCDVCGCESKYFIIDRVNLTNGCMCNISVPKNKSERKKQRRCYAHATKINVLGYHKINCKKCNGTGIGDKKNIVGAIENGNIIEKQYIIETCLKCGGVGAVFIPIYDIDYLLKIKNEKWEKNRKYYDIIDNLSHG